MTRKRFTKLIMAKDYSRDEAEALADWAIWTYKSYDITYRKFIESNGQFSIIFIAGKWRLVFMPPMTVEGGTEIRYGNAAIE